VDERNGRTGGKHQFPAIVKYLLFIAAAFVLGFLLFDLVVMPGLTGKREIVIAPMIEGMSIKQAESVCSRLQLSLVISRRRNSDEVPFDYIISQVPRHGTNLKAGRTIKVVVSDGERMEAVPELSGKSPREAELFLESAGLERGRTVHVFSPGEGQPSVLASSPSPGTRVPHGSIVDILVAMYGEPRTYLMPNLIGRDFPFAKDRLERLGFNIAHRVTKRTESAFPNTIVAQNPLAGERIREGGTIELVISASD
jgi:beta-lactam-binding protein with PASTA domain